MTRGFKPVTIARGVIVWRVKAEPLSCLEISQQEHSLQKALRYRAGIRTGDSSERGDRVAGEGGATKPSGGITAGASTATPAD